MNQPLIFSGLFLTLLSARNWAVLVIWRSHLVDILKAFCGNNHNRVHSSSCYMYCSSYCNSIALITFRVTLHSAVHTAYLLASRSNSITIPCLYSHFHTAMLSKGASHCQFPCRKMPVGNGMYSPLCFPLQMQGWDRNEGWITHHSLSLLGTINDFGYWRVS